MPHAVFSSIFCRYRSRIRTCILTALSALTGLSGTFAHARTYDQVEIRGAQFVAPEDIAAACEIVAGMDYSAADLADVKACLEETDVFRSVAVRGEGNTLVVDVVELDNRPGRVEVGLEYVSDDGIQGNLYFERYNLFPDTFGSVDLSFSKERRAITSSLFYSGFSDQIGIGVDGQLLHTKFDDQGFAHRRSWVQPYVSYRLSPAIKTEFGLGYRRDEMRDIKPGSSTLFGLEAGTVSAPFLRFGVKMDLPDQRPDQGAGTTPRFAGASLSIDQFLWGLGKSERVAELRIEGDVRFALSNQFDLLLKLQAGHAEGVGSYNSRAVDRFFIGGSTFRGFATRGIGPKDGNDFTGANSFAIATLEVQTPIGRLFDGKAKGGAFVDIGSAWGLDNNLGGTIDDRRKMRSSVGLSLTFDVGSTPVSLYVAKPVKSQPGDREQNFGLSINTSF